MDPTQAVALRAMLRRAVRLRDRLTPRVCKNPACARPFIATLQKGRRPHYCSSRCRVDVSTAHQRRQRERPCAKCGTPCLGTQCRTCRRWGQGRTIFYCHCGRPKAELSLECQSCEFASRRRPLLVCQWCGQSFQPRSMKYTKFCSRNCCFKYRHVHGNPALRQAAAARLQARINRRREILGEWA